MKDRRETLRGGRDRALLRAIFALAIPAMIEQALQTIVQYADSAMVGRLGAQASAAVGLTTPVSWLVNSPLFAMGIGFVACIARASGAGDGRTMRVAAVQSLYSALVLGLLVGALTVGLSPFLPGWLGADVEIRADASRYFAIVCAPMVFRAAAIIFGSALRASGDARTPMLITLVMNAVNILLNLLLIFPGRMVTVLGHALWLPGADMGVAGAAVASAIAYTLGGTLMLVCMLKSPALAPRGIPLKVDGPVLAQCVRVGLPVAFTRVGVCLGQVVFLSQVSSLGTVSLAAHSLALTAEEAIYLPGYGMQMAASTLAGNAVGERSEQKLMHVSWIVTLTAALLMTFTGAFMFCFPGWMMGLFTADMRVIAQGVSIMRIVAVTEPIYAVSIILEGVFNGVGDTRAPFLINMFTMWGVRILLTFLCVRVLGWGLDAVWVCMALDNVTRAILLTVRFFRGRWKSGLGLERVSP